MIKKVVVILVMIISITNMNYHGVMANSGPTFWEGSPSLEILSIDENSPIAVCKENLSFNLRETKQRGHSLIAKVKAEYIMKNESDKNQEVMMAFPIVEENRNLDLIDARIFNDGKLVPYEVFIVNDIYAKESNDMDFVGILDGVDKNEYESDLIGEQKAVVYTFRGDIGERKSANIRIDFDMDIEKTKILDLKLNGYMSDGNHRRLSAHISKRDTTIKFVVIGEEPENMQVSFYDKSGDDGKLLKDIGYDKIVEEITTKELIEEYYIKEFELNHIESLNLDTFTGTNYAKYQIYNQFAMRLDDMLKQNSYIDKSSIYDYIQRDKIFTLMYKIDFHAGEEKTISVEYLNRGEMDKTKTVGEIQTFKYILNPARYWKSFNDLEISVITPVNYPYIVDSNLDFKKAEDGIYIAQFNEIPQNDLFFTLYSEEEIIHKGNKFTKFLIGIVLLVCILIVLRYRNGRKAVNKDM